ncbi:MAG: DNA pilot protein [Microvirus sp.]|nr:MAG: DNA pilot protein [Microvirus sp.]
MAFGLSSIVGGLIGGATEAIGGLIGNKGKSDAAAEDRAFQERLSNTAYQRQVEDLRKAGLNPALAYSSSSGASTPKGSTADVENVVKNVSHSASSASRNYAELNLVKENLKKIAQETNTSKAVEDSNRIEQQKGISQIGVNDAIQQNYKADTVLKATNAKALNIGMPKTSAETRLIDANARKALVEAAVAETGMTAAKQGVGILSDLFDIKNNRDNNSRQNFKFKKWGK